MTAALDTPSTLLTTQMSSAATSWSATKRSPPPTPALPSTTRTTTSTPSTASRAVRLSRWPNSVRGLCNPGVSTKTSLALVAAQHCSTAFLVVCGLSETIETFRPTIVLTRLDLPTLALPTMATMPERKPAPGRTVPVGAQGYCPAPSADRGRRLGGRGATPISTRAIRRPSTFWATSR